jgi:urease accessory protein
MIVIEETITHAAIPAGAEHDVLVMGWEKRRRSRQRVSTLHGRDIAIALPTGTVLEDGEIVHIGQEFYVSVEAEQEDVLLVPLSDATTAAALAYELGNRHLPVSLRDGMLATPYDRLVEEVLTKSGVPYGRKKEKFEPLRTFHHHG